MPTLSEMEQFAAHVQTVIFSGNPERIAALLHPNFTVWQNTDGVALSGPAMDRFHQALGTALRSIKFVEQQITGTNDGYVEQHVKLMTTHAGQEHRIPCCMLVSVRGGQLLSVREYMDSTAFPSEVIDARRAIIAGECR